MSGNIWTYLDTGSSDAYTNMAMDEVLLKKMLNPDALPILRVYTWSHPSISVGYFQNVTDDFDLTLCKGRGWPLVRRLTGGRAVFHDHELTYSILFPKSCPTLPDGLFESYRYLSQGFLLALRKLGVEPELVTLQDTKKDRPRPASKSPDCFASPSWYEIAARGRKIMGSAQRRTPYGILQQGSILISTRRFREFYELFLYASAHKHPCAMQPGDLGMTSLTEILGTELPINQVKKAILHGFKEAHGVHFVEKSITPEVQREAHELVEARYRRNSWNLYRKSAFFRENLEENHS